MASRPLRICYFGTYTAEYSRNQIMLAGLRRAGAEVVECHASLWKGIDDRVRAASGGWANLTFVRRVLAAYLDLLRQHRRVGDYDVLLVGYPGHFDVYLARLLSWWRRKPLVWDTFMSIYLIALERRLDQASRMTVWALRQAERGACRLPDLLISDTSDYVNWYCQAYRLRPARFRLVPTGANDVVFRPHPPRPSDGVFRVVYYGTFIPNHGVPFMIEAARCLVGEPAIQFELIGDGPELPPARRLVEQYALSNVIFTDWLAYDDLATRIGQADVCLGAFGLTPQSLMTVQNKIYEGLAMARPVVTGDSPAVRAALTHGVHLFLVDRRDAASLAAALRLLQSDPALRDRLAAAGHQLFCERFSLAALGRQALAHLEPLRP